MRSAFGIIIGKTVGLMIFLIVLAGLNIANALVQNIFIAHITAYLNSTLWLVVVFSILFLLADLFSIFSFPFNLIYPIFNALASLFVILFLSGLVTNLQDESLNAIFARMASLAFMFVPFIVLVVGYASIFFKKTEIEKPIEKEKKPGKGNIGEELEGLILDIIRKMRKGLNEEKPSTK